MVQLDFVPIYISGTIVFKGLLYGLFSEGWYLNRQYKFRHLLRQDEKCTYHFLYGLFMSFPDHFKY